MPTWDEITPYLEKDTTARRWNAVNVIMGANIVGLVGSAFAAFLRVDLQKNALTFNWEEAIQGGQVWRFLTYTFWHPLGIQGNSADLFFSLLAFAFGCYILHSFGRELETEWGWKRFTVIYLASAAYGALIHGLYQAATNSNMPAYDFLGPVLAVLLAMGLRAPDRRILFFFFFPMRLITAALLLIGVVVLFTLSGWHTGVTPAAALGCVAAAFLICKLEPKIDAWLDSREQRVARDRFLDEFELKRQVDGILEKILREGMNSLTSHERKMLKRASKLYADGQHE